MLWITRVCATDEKRFNVQECPMQLIVLNVTKSNTAVSKTNSFDVANAFTYLIIRKKIIGT
ncbi:hypothetical protein [Segetibacter koreensis]|uniref:hypothetical protein n=1 Tax=Segetibacter koreensis TaxID=398037 RepID=UPI0003706A6C|nr:hypothetical protein [Segetibacter koreensis]